MATSYNAQIDNENSKYSIQFETSDHDYFKFVEKACQIAIDKRDRADVAEVRHGEWKPAIPDSDVRFFCSECETEISTSWDYEESDMWKYCPNCGAKMDGKGDGSV